MNAHAALGVDLLKIDVEGHEAAVCGAPNERSPLISPYSLSNAFIRGMLAYNLWSSEGYRFVDGDRLKAQVDSSTGNYFGFPEKFHSDIDLLLQKARERLIT